MKILPSSVRVGGKTGYWYFRWVILQKEQSFESWLSHMSQSAPICSATVWIAKVLWQEEQLMRFVEARVAKAENIACEDENVLLDGLMQFENIGV
jgi:hypothetical protein